MRLLSVGLVALVLVAASSGCSEEGDARDRVLSEKRSPARGDAKPSTSPIDLQKVATDQAERDRLITMTHADLFARLGSHRFRTKSKIRVAIAGNVNTLEEQAELVISPKGSFSVSSSNQKGRGRDIVFVNGLLAHRAAGGTWTLERGDGFEQRFREDCYRMWTVTYKMFRDHLAFGSPQPTDYQGRSAVRYSITLAEPKGNEPPAEEEAPPPLTATDDEREKARLERLVAKRRGNVKRYLAANGHLIVDEQTQAPLAFVFDGQYEVQPRSTKKPAAAATPDGAAPEDPRLAARVSTYHIETEVEEIGKDHVVALPEESKPPPHRRKIDSDPLEGLIDKKAEAKPAAGAAKP